MKKLLSFVALAVIAYGSYVPKAGDAPEVVAKKCFDMLYTNEINQAKQFAKCIQENKRQEFLTKLDNSEAADDIKHMKEKMGGIKSLEIKLLDLFEDRARVKVWGTYKNGESFDNDGYLIKINDTWYFERP